MHPVVIVLLAPDLCFLLLLYLFKELRDSYIYACQMAEYYKRSADRSNWLPPVRCPHWGDVWGAADLYSPRIVVSAYEIYSAARLKGSHTVGWIQRFPGAAKLPTPRRC